MDRLGDTEKHISDLEDRIIKITHISDKKVKKKSKSSLRDLWDNTENAHIHITGILGGEERKKGVENVFNEIMADNFPSLKKETDIQVQEAQMVPYKVKPSRCIPRHIMIKWQN